VRPVIVELYVLVSFAVAWRMVMKPIWEWLGRQEKRLRASQGSEEVKSDEEDRVDEDRADVAEEVRGGGEAARDATSEPVVPCDQADQQEPGDQGGNEDAQTGAAVRGVEGKEEASSEEGAEGGVRTQGEAGVAEELREIQESLEDLG